MSEACEAFQWVGQSFAYCDRCSRPAWEHDGVATTRTDDPSVFGPLRRARWKPTHITSWIDAGYITEERAEEMRNIEEIILEAPPQRHAVDLDTDIDTGMWIASCECGWVSPSFEESVDASRAFGVHVEEVTQ